MMSVPDYHSDQQERNLKHALLNISADIATLITNLSSLVILLRYRNRMACVEYATTLVGLGAAIFGLLSSVGSEESSIDGPLGSIRSCWIGLGCWIAGTAIFVYGEVAILHQRKQRRQREGRRHEEIEMEGRAGS